MLLWLFVALLTIAVVGALVRPVLSGRGSSRDRGDEGAVSPEIALYRDQLAEIDRDAARGLIGATEAETARREVARRLLAIADAPEMACAAEDKGAHVGAAKSHLAAIAASVLLPLAALLIYLTIGSPGLPALPHSEQVAAKARVPAVADLIARVEARLRERPDDGAGWDVVAPVYLRMDRYGDAARAFENAIRLLGATPARLLGLGEALVLANSGTVVPAAKAAMEQLERLEPGRPEPKFWLAVAKEQAGDLEAAAAAYRALIASAPADAAWRQGVVQRLEEVTARQAGGAASEAKKPTSSGGDVAAGEPATGQPQRGPTAEDIKAAQSMSDAERARMVEGMVDGLAARLKADGKDLEGWLRLVRAYKVLGRDAAAVTALGDARKALSEDQGAQAALSALAQSLGLGS